jgi:hypothetical protein
MGAVFSTLSLLRCCKQGQQPLPSNDSEDMNVDTSVCISEL